MTLRCCKGPPTLASGSTPCAGPCLTIRGSRMRSSSGPPRGTSHALSDVDVAIGTTGNAPLGTLDIGELTSRLEYQYGALDWARVYDLAAEGLGDLLSFCDALAARVR